MPVKYTNKKTGKSIILSPRKVNTRPSVYEERTGKRLALRKYSKKG